MYFGDYETGLTNKSIRRLRNCLDIIRERAVQDGLSSLCNLIKYSEHFD